MVASTSAQLCGATAVNKLVKLFDPCCPFSSGQLNFYKAGKAPQGFPDWPFKQINTSYTSAISKVQGQVNSLATFYMEQQAALSSASFSEKVNSDSSSYHSSRSVHVGSDSGSD